MGYFLLVAGLVVYGSLYPFDFDAARFSWSEVSAFSADWNPITSRLDMLGNVLLFVPLGLVSLMRKYSTGQSGLAWVVLLAALALSLALQVAQFFLPTRDAVLADVFWNMAGVLLGLLLNRVFLNQRRFSGIDGVAGPSVAGADRAAVVLICVWLAAQLLPFVPSLDWQQLKNSLKPLLLEPKISLAAVIAQIAAVLLLAQLLARAAPGPTVVWLLFTLAATGVGRVLVVHRALTPSLMIGFGVGLLLWLVAARWSATRRALLIALALLFSYTVTALLPFQLRALPATFDWTPFGQFLHGSMAANLHALAEKSLIFAGILWLVHSSRGRVVATLIMLAVWVGLLEFAQTLLVGRSAGISEPLLVLVVGLLLRIVMPPAPQLPMPGGGRRRRKRKRGDRFRESHSV